MCKSEIFAEILEIVSQETEISVERILPLIKILKPLMHAIC